MNYVYVVCDKILFFLLKFITNYTYPFKEIEEKQSNICFCCDFILFLCIPLLDIHAKFKEHVLLMIFSFLKNFKLFNYTRTHYVVSGLEP